MACSLKTDELLNPFKMALHDAVGRVWPITLVNDMTGEKVRKPLFTDIQAEAVGDNSIRVRGEFFDGLRRSVVVVRSVALASVYLAATEAVGKLKQSKEEQP